MTPRPADTPRPNPAPAGTLARYNHFAHFVHGLSPASAAELAARHRVATRGDRNYRAAAEGAFEQAIMIGRIDDDERVIGADPAVADLNALTDIGNGCLVDLAVAILMRDALTPGFFDLIVRWWRESGLPVPGDPGTPDTRVRPKPEWVPPAIPSPPVRRPPDRRARLTSTLCIVAALLTLAASAAAAGSGHWSFAGWAILAVPCLLVAAFVARLAGGRR